MKLEFKRFFFFTFFKSMTTVLCCLAHVRRAAKRPVLQMSHRFLLKQQDTISAWLFMLISSYDHAEKGYDRRIIPASRTIRIAVDASMGTQHEITKYNLDLAV